MGLFNLSQIEQINRVAEKSKELAPQAPKKTKSVTSEIDAMSAQVIKYFEDSKSILITAEEQLAEYIDNTIKAGYCGIDTETTGLDRIKDTIVGSSLYYPGGVECYIPNKHRIPIFDDLRKNQLTYEQCQRQFQRLVDAKVKMIFANADFDIAMLYKDYGVDFIPACYYDVILAWRCIKENELHNGLKELYNKYVLGGKGDPKKFNDFFDVALFPYCKPEVAKLYAANDAKITYDLFRWQLPYVTKGNPKCQKQHLEKIADVVWGIEFPMIRVCAMMHRTGSYIDADVAKSIDKRYDEKYNQELAKLQQMVQTLIDDRDIPTNSKRPFRTGKEFSPTSVTHARYLCYNLLGVPVPTSGKEKGKQATSKEILAELNLPETNQLLKVRSLSTLITTFVKKLPRAVTPDGRIHAQFRSVGAATGRMCLAEGTLIQVPREYSSEQDFLGYCKKIEDIQCGDYLYSLDTQGNRVSAKVINRWITGRDRECIKLNYYILQNGTEVPCSLICTPEHPILLQVGNEYRWIEAKDLKLSDTVRSLHSFIPAVISGVEKIQETYTVYDIEVEDYHNFFAAGLCVHNSSAEPNLQNIPSHATDIRHMFRATAARDELYNLEESEDTLRCKVMIYDSVTTDEGLKKVNQLEVGDLITLSKKGMKSNTELLNIEDTDDYLYKVLVLKAIEN